MGRRELTDSSGRWLVEEECERFLENPRYDPERECLVGQESAEPILGDVPAVSLLRTPSGAFALENRATGELVLLAPADARAFLARNGHQWAIGDEVGESGDLAEVTEERLGIFSTRLPADLQRRVKAVAAARGVSVQRAAREAFEDWLRRL